MEPQKKPRAKERLARCCLRRDTADPRYPQAEAVMETAMSRAITHVTPAPPMTPIQAPPVRGWQYHLAFVTKAQCNR